MKRRECTGLNLTIGNGTALLIEQANLVSRHRLAGSAVANRSGAVRQKNMQHLGRADAIENFDAGAFAEARPDLFRQSLAR